VGFLRTAVNGKVSPWPCIARATLSQHRSKPTTCSDITSIKRYNIQISVVGTRLNLLVTLTTVQSLSMGPLSYS